MKLFILYFFITTVLALDHFGGPGGGRVARDAAATPVRPRRNPLLDR